MERGLALFSNFLFNILYSSNIPKQKQYFFTNVNIKSWLGWQDLERLVRRPMIQQLFSHTTVSNLLYLMLFSQCIALSLLTAFIQPYMYLYRDVHYINLFYYCFYEICGVL